MEDSPLLPIYLRDVEGGGEETVPVRSAVAAVHWLFLSGYQGPVLLVAGIAFTLPVSANTNSSLGHSAAPVLLS